jgi:hypothetical protein
MSHIHRLMRRIALAFPLALCVLAGCQSAPSDQTVRQISEKPAKPEERVAKQRTVLPPGQPAAHQETFATADDAVKALVLACESKDHADMKKIFGPAVKDFVTGDAVEDENDFNAFTDATAERAVLEETSPNAAILHIGKDDWSFPIPLVKTKDGKWYFDTIAGETEILARRIGSDELEAIALCRTYVDAQREYASQDRDGSGVLKYARRLASSPGQHDGLYWPTEDDAKGAGPSPFGPLIAAAAAEGYPPISGAHSSPTAYHGYYFHILKAQGASASGGAYDYVINGNMIAGFALVAYPAEYGKSGIMTFIVSHQGTVYQKDLGPNTADLAAKMTQYDPDSSWSVVKE